MERQGATTLRGNPLTLVGSEIKAGDAPAPLVCGPVTRTDFVRYAGASHDFNPNHHDEIYATRNGNKMVFAPGMLAGGYCARQRDPARFRGAG